MSFDKYMQACNHQFNQGIEWLHHLLNIPLCHFVVNPSPDSQVLANTDLFSGLLLLFGEDPKVEWYSAVAWMCSLQNSLLESNLPCDDIGR